VGCYESVYFKSASKGVIESIAHQGVLGPLGAMYRYAWGPVLNNRGDVLFMGELVPPPGIRAYRGIFLYNGNVTIPIAFPGDVMPDGRRIETVNPSHMIGNYSVNDRGDVCFNASLQNGGSAIYIYSDGLLHPFAGTGTVVPGVGTISSVTNLLAINGGLLNDRGQILFWTTLTDGKGVLLLATPQDSVKAK
jgi:hypothetical protein